MKKVRGGGQKAFKKIRARSAKVKLGKRMPNLDDYAKKVPKGGLLNPGLRKGAGLGMGKNVSKIRPMKKPKGKFSNLGM